MTNTVFLNMETKKLAEKILDKHKLCDSCLGRLFTHLNRGIKNVEKGGLLRKELQRKKISPENCWLCEGLTSETEEFAEIIEEKLRDYEFSTFLIGSKIDEDICKREEKLCETFSLEHYEPLKIEINREVGKIVSKKMNKQTSFNHPDITVLLDTRFNHVDLQITPLFIYGRYIKKVRGVPQTKWPCRICRGKGCRRCNYTGKMYETSVEEIISAEILKATKAEDESFHGCGREDIDALMLGKGRPFILEVKNPRVRSIDLKELEKKINKYGKGRVEVNSLRFSNKEEVVRIKKAAFPKIYHAKVAAEKEVPEEKLKEVVNSLQGKTIKQLTPTRVTHRRALKTRERKIYHCRILELKGKEFKLEIHTESGTYIKELVSGDNGRTKPSISEMLRIPCVVEELDVVAVEGE